MNSIRACWLSILAAGLLATGATVTAQESTQPQSSELQSSDPATAPVELPSEPADEKATLSNGQRQITHIGSDSVLSTGEKAGTLVSIGGSVASDGEVSEAVVAIGGDVRVRGRVGGEVVAVLGDVNVNGRVGGDAVAVFGDMELGPEAKISGDVVTVGGRLRRDPAATIDGSVQEVSFPDVVGQLDGLRPWIQHALLYGRPLALDESLTWAWFLAIGLLAFYVTLTVLFPGASERCVDTLETHPGSSLLAALLSMLLMPFLLLLLVMSVVGLAAVPVFILVLLGVGLFGKATALAAVGHRLVGHGSSPFNHVAMAALVGGLIVLALYLIPVVGFIAFALTGLLGFGAVIYTLILGAKEKHRSQAAANAGDPLIHHEGPSMQTETATHAEPSSASTLDPSIASLPRASFGLRMAALLIDVVLVAVIVGWTGTLLVPLAIYGAIMWRLKGATIGGIVFGLQVARVDGHPIDWPTAIVRALGCFLSLVALGLGFLWILFDSERQAWHDKIAGTVVYVRKGLSLT